MFLRGVRPLLRLRCGRVALATSRGYHGDQVATLGSPQDSQSEDYQLLARDIPAISFTTDKWSLWVSAVSMLSLAAQWIDKDLNLIKAVLHSQEFMGSHSASHLRKCLKHGKWTNPKCQIVTDNARNMAKASFGCMAHTQQLALHDGALSQRSIVDVVAGHRAKR
ncbi:hypothetical protein N1851_034880 [Merluccius polli]|uniref:Uncharacterized protein n=1 Tax=Merluccius polli TaxID=89951 RepID=A0AA47LZ47_MERPO|nr:hypothetical protein N1851_034880 [Merluccius polli]